MSRSATAKCNQIRNVVGIGQIWQHHRPEFSIAIKQIHRADRLVEAWFDGPDGRASHDVTFADLRREYELLDKPDVVVA
jgi:hypothetical protein